MERVLNKAIIAAMRTRALLEEPEIFENSTNERLVELLTVIHNVLHTRGVRVDIQKMLYGKDYF